MRSFNIRSLRYNDAFGRRTTEETVRDSRNNYRTFHDGQKANKADGAVHNRGNWLSPTEMCTGQLGRLPGLL